MHPFQVIGPQKRGDEQLGENQRQECSQHTAPGVEQRIMTGEPGQGCQSQDYHISHKEAELLPGNPSLSHFNRILPETGQTSKRAGKKRGSPNTSQTAPLRKD